MTIKHTAGGTRYEQHGTPKRVAFYRATADKHEAVGSRDVAAYWRDVADAIEAEEDS